MSSNIVLRPPSHPLETWGLSGADAVLGFAAMLAFSFIGMVLDLLALIGLNGGACATVLSFCLIAFAPALAAVGALGVARTRPTCRPEDRPQSL